ncbi:MAG: Crp/Fnr family transcriptional regulator [Myxococcales bacterium]|nr:Crp/Fnr family transcriptional regulator [Myxococcales bacterium]MBL0196065.1 Crp/Fnr family transcriptional regulator [Myxococcales bacterium]HQY62404.1 Crp/Fnr family transcriptional regulator [Polyangiaceae bacterium]
MFSLKTGSSKAACTLCPIGAASHVGTGSVCPMVDRRRPAGSTLFVAGAPAEAVYYVKHGSIALSRGGTEALGEGAPHALRRAGSLLGLEAIIRPTYLDSARAISDVTVCVTSRTQMLAWLSETGTSRVVLDCLLATLASDNPSRATTDGSAPQRIARWLLDSTQQRRLPRSVLAGLLGMKPETLSRGLATLVRGGSISATRTRIEILDASLLEAIAGGASRETVARDRSA